MGYIVLPTEKESSLEGRLQRGVVSLEAASELTLQGEDNATIMTYSLLKRRYMNKYRLAVLVLARL